MIKRSDLLIGAFAIVATGLAVYRVIPAGPLSVALVDVERPGVQERRYLGDALAKHSIIIYTDYECPACRRLDREVAALLDRHADSVVVFYRHFPLEEIHFQAMKAAELAECASYQGRFAKAHQLLMQVDFEAGPQWADDVISKVGIRDTNDLRECMDSPATNAAVLADMSTGTRLGLRGTPAIITNRRLYFGVMSRNALERAVF